MRDRRTFDTRQRPGADASRNASQRNALIAIVFFVAAFAFVAVMLLTGRGDDTPTTAGSASTPAAFRQIGDNPTPTPSTITGQSPAAGATSATTAPTGAAETGAPTATGSDTEAAEPTEELPAESTGEAPTEPTEPEPTVAPLIGDFGPLPPAQIVSGGLSRGLSLDYVLDRSAVSAPETGTVFKFVWPEYTADDVSLMASNLGIVGVVEPTSSGAFRVNGANQSLFVRPHAIQYSNSSTALASLADDATLIASAESWLASSGLVNSEVGSGRIIGRNDEADIAVVLVQPASPSPLLAAFPSASITVTGAGVVREANVQWPADYVASEYGMRALSEVWNQVLAGQGAIEADLSGVSGSGAITATFTVESVGLAYSVGSGSAGEFLMPIMVFSGTAIADDGTAFPVWVYMSAVQGEASAAG